MSTEPLNPGRNYPRRILAVDDDPVVREFLKMYLAVEGVEVDLAEDGAEAMERMPGGYDLLVLDLEMPRLSGFEVLRSLDPVASGLPVVVLTSRTDASAIGKAFELGAAAYVLKPISQASLIAKISKVYSTAAQ